MSRLGLGLGLTKGGVIPFNPLSLDPYLLFDTQSSMIGTFENPTLDLDPSVPSTLDVITATRAGVATYTDADGLIQSAAPNTVRVDYTQGAELTPTVYQRVGYTDFSSGWGAFWGFTVQSASDFGGQPAIRLVSDGTSSNYYQFEIQNTGEQQQYVFSFYCRRVSGSGDIAARHALSVTGSSTSITVTANWQRVSVTCLGRTGGGSIFVGLIQSTGDGVYEFSQPQVEEGTTASDFVANTTGSPKFITGATFGPRLPMILVEPSSENLVPYTDFSTNHWAYLSGTVVTTDTTLNPDGTTAKKFSAANGVSSSSVRSTISTPTTSNTYTLSWYAKAGGFDESMVRIDAGGATIKGSVNLLSGAVTLQTGSALDSISSEAVSGGWFRISMTISLSGAGGSIMTRFYPTYSNGYIGDGSSGVYLAQPQVETGSVATSSIPTSGSTVTRAADDLQIERDSTNLVTNTDFSDWVQASNTTLTDGSGYAGQPSKIFEATSGTHRLFRSTTFGSTAGTTYVGSIWIRRVSGSGAIYINHQASAQGNLTTITDDISEEWTRVEADFTGHASSGDMWFGIWVAVQGDSVEIAMPQVEEGTVATSYIPTSGAAASRTAFSSFYNGAEGTFYLEAIDRDPTSGTHSFLRGQSEHRDFLFKYNGTSIHSFDGSTGVNQSGIAANQLFRAAVSYKSGSRTLSLNGTSPADGSLNTNWSTADRLRIGNGNAVVANMHVKRVIFWPYHKDNL